MKPVKWTEKLLEFLEYHQIWNSTEQNFREDLLSNFIAGLVTEAMMEHGQTSMVELLTNILNFIHLFINTCSFFLPFSFSRT